MRTDAVSTSPVLHTAGLGASPDECGALASILGSMPDAVFVKDLDRRYVFVNAAAAAIAGRPASELLGLRGEEVFPPQLAATLSAYDFAVIDTGRPMHFETTIPHAESGAAREYLVTKGLWRRPGDGAPGGVIVHAAELERSNSLYSGIVALSTDAIITVDEHQRILLFNHAAERIFGYAAAEIVGQHLDLLLPAEIRDVHRERHFPGFAMEGAAAHFAHQRSAVRARRKSGEIFPAEITITRVTTGGVTRFSGVLRDITEQQRRDEELERQRQELARSNAELARSNAELEQFAYVASHDLQEPLRAVASHTQLLAERYGDRLDDRALKHIHFAVEGARRMQALIEDLLSLSRVGTHARPFETVQLDTVLAGVLRSLGPSIAESGGVIHATPLPIVQGDPAQLDEVLLNLVANALKFRRPDVAPEVTIGAEPSGDQWVIAIQDNGIGIEPMFAERIFEVFRRLHTREEYPGTGIGLSICRKVIERHGGRIWMEPAPGGGSIFRFTLPRPHPADPAAAEAAP